MSEIGILGSGVVGPILAAGLRAHGHDVTVASRSGKAIDGWDGPVATFTAAAAAEIVILAVKGTAAEELVSSLADQLAGKPVLDTTNPIADAPPVDGVLQYFTDFDDSLLERLQRAAPRARLVKWFNSVGGARMVNPQFADGVRPSMFIAGDDEAAKAVAADLAGQLGWEVEDMGSAVAARAIEPLCMLWCVPGLRGGSWTHAFKMLH